MQHGRIRPDLACLSLAELSLHSQLYVLTQCALAQSLTAQSTCEGTARADV